MITTIIALILIADTLLYILKRDIIEPRVHASLPKINCAVLAALELIGGTILLLL